MSYFTTHLSLNLLMKEFIFKTGEYLAKLQAKGGLCGSLRARGHNHAKR